MLRDALTSCHGPIDGEPVAELVPSFQGRRPFGIDEGKIRLAADFDAPLPDEIARAFGDLTANWTTW